MSLAEVQDTAAIHVVGPTTRWQDAFVHGSHVALSNVGAWGKVVEVSGLVAAILDAHPLVVGISASKEQSKYLVRVWLSLCNEAAIEVILSTIASFPTWAPSVVCHAPPAPGFSTPHVIRACTPPLTLPSPSHTPESESLMQRRGLNGLPSIGISEGYRGVVSPPTPMLDWTVTPSAKGSAPPSASHMACTSTPSSTKAMRGGSSPAWGSNLVSPVVVVDSQPQRVSPKAPLGKGPQLAGPQTTPSDSDPFISNGWAYPGGLNRKERRRILFALNEDPNNYPGAVYVGRPDGPIGLEEYNTLLRAAKK